MDVYFPMTVSNRPAWFAPLQYSERPPLYVAFFEEPIEELLRLRLQAPVVRVVRNVFAPHPTFEDRWGRQLADEFFYCPSLTGVPLRKLELHRLVFFVVKADHEDALPDLGHTEILCVEFAFEDRESSRRKELFEVAEEFSVCLIP